MSCVLRISVITIWTVEPWMKTPALICRCLQALAEALKINASVTKMSFECNQIGAEGAKAWCVVGSAESLNAAACHDVMSPTSFDSDKFGWFGGAVVSPFIFHRKESCQICRCCKQLSLSALFAKFCIREIHMSELNVMCSPDFSDHDLNGRALDEDASLDLSLFPGLGRCAEDKRVRQEHPFGIQQDWRRGRQGLVCGGLRRIAECCGMSCCHIFDILWQWQVWPCWRCCSFIIHLWSSWVVSKYADAEYCWMIWMNCGCLKNFSIECHLLWAFQKSGFVCRALKSRRQPWSVAASRPWPRRWRQTHPSRTSIWNATRLVPRGPRPGVRLSPLNAATCIHVMSSTFFDRKKFCLIVDLWSRRVVKYVEAVSNCWFLDCLPSLESERLTCLSEMSFCFDHRALEQDADLDMSLPPGLGRGTGGDQQVHDEHRFAIQPDWRWGWQGLVCVVGFTEYSLNAAACIDVIFWQSDVGLQPHCFLFWREWIDMLLVNELKQHPGKLNPGSSSLGIRRRPPLPMIWDII